MLPVRPSSSEIPGSPPEIPGVGPAPMQGAAVSRRFTPRPRIWKYCFECQGYYQGQLDGEYRCPDCREAGRTHARALAPLDGLLAVLPESLSIVPHRDPERIYAEIGAQQKATG